ncbi:hypothetical protein [Streptomyces cellulosae]|uniref:hypothetical protein n=1 Tax=Streptomyces cellulosae TaxID=1968 RepID=UPI002D218F64|nr:hypothetical protein [Streptomyces cellulosae]
MLDRILSGAADAPLVACLQGPGGIGKSSLVRYAARQAEITAAAWRTWTVGSSTPIHAGWRRPPPRRAPNPARCGTWLPGALAGADLGEWLVRATAAGALRSAAAECPCRWLLGTPTGR